MVSSAALPEDVRALAPEVPWLKITGMRNVLVHGYFEIDADLVWDAATRDVAGLKPAIERLAMTLKRRRK
ncbi:MAG TPA: HepT-like ribonuclease domain-containing protein [Candidatus Acidoferrales bacterium]|nr:HepT-like ribonuclease domain-containing protein [Candidatus Acidoferrales bacterium]